VQLSSGRKGRVTAIVPNYLELDFGGKNDTGCCPWNDVQKVVEAGDFIIITSGILLSLSWMTKSTGLINKQRAVVWMVTSPHSKYDFPKL